METWERGRLVRSVRASARWVGFALLLGLLPLMGCGADRTASGVTGPDGGVLHFDAAMVTWDGGRGSIDGGRPMDGGRVELDAGVSVDAGTWPPCEAELNSQGILTNRPDMRFTRTEGPFVARTFFVHGFEAGGAAVFAEVVNDTTSMVCIPLANINIDGLRLSGVVTGPAYERSSSLSTVCAPPGAMVVMDGVSAGVPAGYTDTARVVEYSTSGLTGLMAVPDSARPVVRSGEFAVSETGRLVIRGEAYFPETITNVRIDFFVRNDCGLITGKMAAFHLETAVAGLSWDFEARGLLEPVPEGVPTDWIYMSSYIQD